MAATGAPHNTNARPATSTTILVVEDHTGARQLIGHCLRSEGYRVLEARDGAAARRALDTGTFGLVLLDLNLPDMGGMELLELLRRPGGIGRGVLPVIVVSGRDAVPDRVAALRAGADDYVVKPFAVDEFLARVEAVLRRAAPETGGDGQPSASSLRYGDLEIDLASRQVRRDGTAVALTAREFSLLAHLASAPGRVFTKSELLAAIWASSPEWQDPSTVTEHIRRIRRKVEEDPDRPRHVLTSRGAGYSFQP